MPVSGRLFSYTFSACPHRAVVMFSLSLNTISALPQSTTSMCLSESLTTQKLTKDEPRSIASQSGRPQFGSGSQHRFFERCLNDGLGYSVARSEIMGPLETYYELSKIAVMVSNCHSVQPSKFSVIIQFLHTLYSLPTCLPTLPPLTPCMSLPRCPSSYLW